MKTSTWMAIFIAYCFADLIQSLPTVDTSRRSKRVLDVEVQSHVRNAPPRFEQSLYIAPIWHDALPNSTVVRVKATDNDVGHTEKLEYSLLDQTSVFGVEPSGGQVYVVSLEGQSGTVITRVKATDPLGLFDTATVSVVINFRNQAPVFNVTLYRQEILDDAPPNSLVVEVKATDPNQGETAQLIYSLVSPSSIFAVEPSSGQVYVLSVAGESGKKTLQVRATDPHGAYGTTTVEVTININKKAPVFNLKLYKADVPAEAQPNTPVIIVKATDPNVGETEKLQYSMLGPSSQFAVIPSTGQVYVVSLAGLSGTVTAIVKATDPAGLSDTTTVEVRIRVRNKAPVFNEMVYRAEIYGDATYNSSVVQVNATDPNVEDTGRLLYSVVGSSSMFDVEPSTGQVYVVSLGGQTGEKTVLVMAEDPLGLHDTTRVEVIIKEPLSVYSAAIIVGTVLGTLGGIAICIGVICWAVNQTRKGFGG